MHYMLVLFFFLGVFFTYESQAIFILTSRSAKKRLKQTKVYHVFLLCLKGNDPQTFKSSSRKNLFLHCVCYWYYLLPWISFILCDNWTIILVHKGLSLLWGFLTATIFFCSQAFPAKIKLIMLLDFCN